MTKSRNRTVLESMCLVVKINCNNLYVLSAMSFIQTHLREKHIKHCLTTNGKQAIKMPEKDNNVLKYNNFHKQLPVPFVINADFEAITKSKGLRER